jgi:calcineurin-like phosphoesterase family protein
MNEQKLLELKWLRQLYIEDLSRIVTYHKNPRPRVAHPGKWAKLESIVALNEGIDEPLMIPPINQDRKVWAWSDQHFFHKNIIAYSERPHDNVDQMNEYMIANYNEYVGEDDICIWGGDVGFKGTTIINELLEQCNGYKILIVGNHDFDGKKLRHLNFDETHLIYTVDYPDVSMVFTHYPMMNVPWPWVNVHGHLHVFPNPISGHPLHINVNCELQGYRPRLLDEIAKQAKMRVISAKM